MRKEVKLLEDHAKLSPGFVEVGRWIGHINTINPYFPACRRLNHINTAKQRAFATTTRAQENDNLSPLDCQVNAAAMIYLALTTLFTWVMNRVERRLKAHD